MKTPSLRTYLGFVAGIILASTSGCAASTDTTHDPDGAEEGQANPGGKADDFAEGSCAGLEDDPYVLTGVSQGGKDEGKCLDTTIFRAARSLRGNAYVDAASAYGFAGAQQALEASGDSSLASANYALVANLKHDGEFWVGEVPLVAGSIVSAYYLIEEFEIPVAENLPPQLEELLETYLPEEAARLDDGGNYVAAHGMIRITFHDSTPVLLRPQFPSEPSRTASFHELVLSVHAVAHVPGEYDPAEGMKDAYGTARGVYSLKEKVDVSIGQLGNTIRQWKVDLDGGTIRKVLISYLARSTERGLQDPYNTVTRNCGSELFETMESVLGRRAGFDVRSVESIDEIPTDLIFPTLGRNYPKYAEQGLVGLQVLPLHPGEQPDSLGRVTPDQIPGAYRMPTLNQQVQDQTVRLD